MSPRKGMRGASALAVVIAAACWWLGGFALASSGRFEDGNGEGATVDKIDISEVAHDDEANEISYELTFSKPWTHSALGEIVFTLDFTPDNADAAADACIRIFGSGQPLDGTVLDDCTDSIADDVTVEHADGESVMTISLSKAALNQANGDKPVTGYAYRVVARDDDAGANQSHDFAPDEGTPPARHNLGTAAAQGPAPSDDPDADDDDGDDGSPADTDDGEDEDEGSDVDGGSDDDVEVLGASVGNPRLPDTGPTEADPSGLRAVFGAGAALLGAGVLLRMLARRSES